MYEVVQIQAAYAVLEQPTNQYIAKGLSLQEATSLSEKLNGGSGFQGATPTFLVEGVNNAK
jgi:hypothetical protein